MNNTMRFIILVLVVGAVVAVFLLKQSRIPEPASDEGPTRETEVTEAASRPLPRLVDLGANTCIPCKMMAPILEELKKEYAGALVVEVIDIREDKEAAQAYGIKVIPTQIFFDASGKEFSRHEGFLSKEAILSTWSEAGITLTPVDS